MLIKIAGYLEPKIGTSYLAAPTVCRVCSVCFRSVPRLHFLSCMACTTHCVIYMRILRIVDMLISPSDAMVCTFVDQLVHPTSFKFDEKKIRGCYSLYFRAQVAVAFATLGCKCKAVRPPPQCGDSTSVNRVLFLVFPSKWWTVRPFNDQIQSMCWRLNLTGLQGTSCHVYSSLLSSFFNYWHLAFKLEHYSTVYLFIPLLYPSLFSPLPLVAATEQLGKLIYDGGGRNLAWRDLQRLFPVQELSLLAHNSLVGEAHR